MPSPLFKQMPPRAHFVGRIPLPWDETFDIGADTGTPVDDRDYRVPFRFTGKISKLTISLDRPKLTPEDEKRLMQTAESAADGK